MTATASVTIVVSVLLASAAAAGVALSLRPAADMSPADGVASLQRELAMLRQDNAALHQRVEQLAKAPAPAAAAPAVERTAASLSTEQVAAAVEAYLQKRDGATSTAGIAGVAEDAPFDPKKVHAELAAANYWDNPEAWKRALASGRLDDVIAQFEAAAKANPNDPNVQMQLANAYGAYIQMDPSKGPTLGLKVDKVYDHVLELDPKHWEARFSKAVSYTFWPDFLGKKKDAISHFETLVQQQEEMPVSDEHAQTYLFLGNLLEARDPAKAKEIWQRGARRHPSNQELVKKAGG